MISLATPIEHLPKIGSQYQKKLRRLGIKTIRDLVFYFPSRYEDFSDIIPIKKVNVGHPACIQGEVIALETTQSYRKSMTITEAMIEDATGTIKAIWFNQPYLEKSIHEGDYLCLAGKVSLHQDGPYLNNPIHEKIDAVIENETLVHTGRIVPIYPETKGLTSRWLRYIIRYFLDYIEEDIEETLPDSVLKKYKLLGIQEAVRQAHFPDSFESADAAKARFAFEDLLLVQLSVLQEKYRLQERKAPACPMDATIMKSFVAKLPFELTDSQKQCSYHILKDLEKSVPMSRLLEGDVGSGKTVVAVMAALSVVKNGYQVALMSPTEILAKQHFKNITKLLESFSITIGLLTGKEAMIFKNGEGYTVKKSDFIEDIKNGQIDIVTGTHSLVQKGVIFKNLGLVILDEQHRFGVNQRSALVRGSHAEQTRKKEDNATESLLHEDLSYKIQQCLFSVKTALGSGHKEVIYQRALEEEFKKAKLNFSREKQISIMYGDKKIGAYVPDFVVDEKIIVELKTLPFLGSVEKKQLWDYLKGSEYKLALIANFGPKELTIERIIYETARRSASVPQSSAYIPHLLSMTATPIPRTLALTIYGDLDISLIKEMPKDRKKIKTLIIDPKERTAAYRFIEEEVKKGRGVFVICPKIETKKLDDKKLPTSGSFVPLNYPFAGAQKDEVKAVKEEYERLSTEIFPDLRITMLTGKMKPVEKEKIMLDFKNGEIDILVSTSVIEVGIDIPRATIMMIEGAERFGLAQLHQFRGRVGRSDLQSYCFLFTTSPDQLNRKRLKALVDSNNGFELAQKDLEIRGPGQLYGNQQWGLPDMAMQGLGNIFLVEKTRTAAKEILDQDPKLAEHPILKEAVGRFKTKIHFE